MKASQVRQMSDDQLKTEEQSLRKQLFDFRSQVVTSKLENPRQIKATRKDLARILTEKKVRLTQAAKA